MYNRRRYLAADGYGLVKTGMVGALWERLISSSGRKVAGYYDDNFRQLHFVTYINAVSVNTLAHFLSETCLIDSSLMSCILRSFCAYIFFSKFLRYHTTHSHNNRYYCHKTPHEQQARVINQIYFMSRLFAPCLRIC